MKIFFLTIAIILIAELSQTMAYTAGSGIRYSPHDLSASGNGMQYGAKGRDSERVCIWCHAPHHSYRLAAAGNAGTGPAATMNYSYLPLWDHNITIQHFTPYSSGPDAPVLGPKAFNGAGDSRIGGVSLLCLSCHDGSIAVNISGLSSVTIADEYKIGKDGNLTNHHPMGFDYERATALDKELAPAAEVVSALRGASAGGDIFSNGRMECPTCHSVHNTGNTGEKLLWISDRGSQFCCTCHLKCSTNNLTVNSEY